METGPEESDCEYMRYGMCEEVEDYPE